MIRAAQKPFFTKPFLAPVLLLLLGFYGCASPSNSEDAPAKQVDTLEGSAVYTKTAPRTTYFTGEYDMPIEDIRAQTRPLAEKVAIAAVKDAKLDIVGPLTLFLPDWKQRSDGEITLGVGYPVSGRGPMLPRFQQAPKAAFKCLSVMVDAGGDTASVWNKLYKIADKQGLRVSGENRAVITAKAQSHQIELQLGLL